MGQQYYVYIMTNKWNTTLYTGITSDLRRRVYEHREKLVDGFTKRCNINKLVYYESCGDVENAVMREKQIKRYRRVRKIKPIESVNPQWSDLSKVL